MAMAAKGLRRSIRCSTLCGGTRHQSINMVASLSPEEVAASMHEAFQMTRSMTQSCLSPGSCRIGQSQQQSISTQAVASPCTWHVTDVLTHITTCSDIVNPQCYAHESECPAGILYRQTIRSTMTWLAEDISAQRWPETCPQVQV